MDVSSFMGGNFLTHLDLPAPSQVWTIRGVSQQLVGGVDTKICVQFAEHAKPLGCNKVNLRTIAQAFGVDSNGWIGRQLEVYRDQTQFQGRTMPCVRVRIPQQLQQPAQIPPQVQYAPQPAVPAYPPAMQQPVQPVQAPPQTPGSNPWDI